MIEQPISTRLQEPLLAARRLVFAGLVLATSLAAVAGLAYVLSGDGIGTIDILMLAAFALTLPWTMIGFWNAVIGFVLLRLQSDAPQSPDNNVQIPKGRTAILMCVHNEDPERVFNHLGKIAADLDSKGLFERFDIHLLSDTTDPLVAEEEQSRFARWSANTSYADHLFYRRREDNTDHKNGNLWEFLGRSQGAYDYFLLLDADSLMSATRIAQMAARMDSEPKLGIYQALIVGLPNPSPFARIFQFGMRQGMRSYTTGANWWQGASGPCWGHNVIVRMQPFVDHCALPRLPGDPPLGGLVLSHDQIEAALMRGAGYRVRVLVEESGSYEENPPTLRDYIARDLRWCQGNMQYFRLIGMPGITTMGRIQLVLAILMYTAAPAWLAFILLGLGQAALPSLVPSLAPTDLAAWSPATAGFAIGLFVMMMTFNLAPKIAGLIDVLCRADVRRSYGGAGKVLSAGLIEFLFSIFLAPIVAVAQAMFLAGLARGRTIRWEAQERSHYELSLRDAQLGLWPQTLLGLAIAGILYAAAPGLLPWVAPIFLPLILAAPFAALTTRRRIGLWMTRHGLCATPEEHSEPQIMRIAPRAMLISGESVEATA